MLPYADLPAASLYRVEVSGWDKTQAFFVEKVDLEWNAEAAKHVGLAHALRENAIIFVRLLEPIAPLRSYPLAYKAEFVATLADGRHEYRLVPVHPAPVDTCSPC